MTKKDRPPADANASSIISIDRSLSSARRVPHRSHASTVPLRLHHHRQVVPSRVARACVCFCLLPPRAHSASRLRTLQRITTEHASQRSQLHRIAASPRPRSGAPSGLAWSHTARCPLLLAEVSGTYRRHRRAAATTFRASISPHCPRPQRTLSAID